MRHELRQAIFYVPKSTQYETVKEDEFSQSAIATLKQGRKITFGYGNRKIEPERRTKVIGDDQVRFN